MHRSISFPLTLAFTSLWCASALAAGWTQPREQFYLKVWNRTLVGSGVYTEGRDTVELPETYQDHQINLYGEYGLTDRLTLTLSATPFGFSAYDDRSRAYFGGGSVGVRYQLHRGSWVAAVAVDAGGRPSSGEPLSQGLVEGELVLIEPVVGSVYGSGSFEVGYGLSFGWLSAHAGTRFFSNADLDPALFGGAQLGWNVGAGFVLDLHTFSYYSFGEFRPINVLGGGQTRYVGFGLGAAWWFTDRTAVSVSLGGVFVAVANAATPSINLGFEFR